MPTEKLYICGRASRGFGHAGYKSRAATEADFSDGFGRNSSVTLERLAAVLQLEIHDVARLIVIDGDSALRCGYEYSAGFSVGL